MRSHSTERKIKTTPRSWFGFGLGDPPERKILSSELAGLQKRTKVLHLFGSRPLRATKPPPPATQQPFDAGQRRVQLRIYACVFVCLCGMAGQRNARAHAWLSRHNGPALSHCREIPP